MQRKYNMALQHFYQAATHSTTDDDDMKAKLKDLSGSEENLFERQNFEYDETKEMNCDTNENYFTYKKEMCVKRVKPVSICSLRGSSLLCIWFVLFLVGVISISYCLQIAISRIPNKKNINSDEHSEQHSEEYLKNNTSNNVVKIIVDNHTEPCSDFEIKQVWTNTFDKKRTQSSIRLVDVNRDGIDDILFGFSNAQNNVQKLCKNFNDEVPCFGGVIAINGSNGKELWIHYTMHEVKNINCNADLNKDGYADCLCSGPGSVLEAVNGKTGELIWKFHNAAQIDTVIDFLMPQFINDLDGDGILDVLQFHAGHTPISNATNIFFLSGRTGDILKAHNIGNGTDIHASPVTYLGDNGSAMVVYGTGDASHGGHLFVISLHDLYSGHLNKSQQVLSNEKKGFMNPPILVDVNGDGTVDIINAGFGDKIQAVDGITLKLIWTYHSTNTETYSTPAVGYYNKDETVDFLIRVNTGSGFPVYYDSKVLILDGKTGLPLNEPYKTSAPVHSSPLSISMEGLGNDLFLYWSADCLDHENQGGWYNLVQSTDVKDSILSDSCVSRFGKKSFKKLYVTNQKIGFPGKAIFVAENQTNQGPNNEQTLLVQTGAIAHSLTEKKRGYKLLNKFDIVFGTSYMTVPHVRVITPSDVNCIKEFREKAAKGKDGINEAENFAQGEDDIATKHCLSKKGNGTKFNHPKKNNFNYGKLTLYRYQITCACELGKKCSNVLPKMEQGWSEHMGSLSNGLFIRRPKGRTLSGRG